MSGPAAHRGIHLPEGWLSRVRSLVVQAVSPGPFLPHLLVLTLGRNRRRSGSSPLRRRSFDGPVAPGASAISARDCFRIAPEPWLAT